MTVDKRPFSPIYRRDNGLFVIDIDVVNDLPFKIKERSLVNIPTNALGGNHKHPRWEAFVGLGEGLKLVWQDEAGQNQEEQMNHDGELFIFIIAPNTAHTVINNSNSTSGILLEFASESQHDVQETKII